MKAIKMTFFSLLVLYLGTSLFTSCSKEEHTENNVSENAKVNSYLKSFYTKDFQFGKSIETETKSNSSTLNKSVEVENLVITEVFVGEDIRARGYIITIKDTNDFLYFIDVNRVDLKLTTVKVDVNDTKVFNNINELDKYLSTDKFDYIKIAEDYVIDETGKRRFWGSSYSQGPCNQETGLAQLYEDYYVFGIRVHHTPSEDIVTGGDVYEPCGMH